MSKPIISPLVGHFKLSPKQSSTTEKEKQDMKNVPYKSAMGNLMYAMMCTRPNITCAVGVVSQFLSNSGKKY